MSQEINATTNTLPCLITVTPKYYHRVWGGQILQKNPANPIGEAWLVHENNLVENFASRSLTLAQLTAEYSFELLGRKTAAVSHKFPLLIKILDCADWLSIQVHPNDAQATMLEGPGRLGKTEAWNVLEAGPNAELIAGVLRGTTTEDIATAIRAGTVLDVVAHHKVGLGDTAYVPAGTIHALGPGLLIYEVQQSSDLTYRVWDWNRPASAGRDLHIAQSIEVTDPSQSGEIVRAQKQPATGVTRILTNDFFCLDSILLPASQDAIRFHTLDSCHVLTATSGSAMITCGDISVELQKFDSAIVPAWAVTYSVTSVIGCVLLRSIPG